MKKVAIIYNSKTGTTKNYSEEMGNFLREKNNDVTVLPIQDYCDDIIKEVDYLLLGSWTNGLMFFYQHPDKKWTDFISKLPDPIKPRIALFTTYRILTGSMLKKMQNQIEGWTETCFNTFKSRNGHLSEADKIALVVFTNSN